MTDTEKEMSAYSKAIPFIIIGLIIFTQLVGAFYAVYDTIPPDGFVLLSYLALFWLIGDWFSKDSKKYPVEWAYDMGFFLYIFWPILIPYYLFATRGFTSALSITLGYGSLYFGTYLISFYVLYLLVQ